MYFALISNNESSVCTSNYTYSIEANYLHSNIAACFLSAFGMNIFRFCRELFDTQPSNNISVVNIWITTIAFISGTSFMITLVYGGICRDQRG
jgi:hypothetical protein